MSGFIPETILNLTSEELSARKRAVLAGMNDINLILAALADIYSIQRNELAGTRIVLDGDIRNELLNRAYGKPKPICS